MENNGKKSLDVMLARDDYKRLTDSLKERTSRIAEMIRNKMEELDIPCDDDYDNGEIGYEGVTVRVASVRSNSCGSHKFLGIKREYLGDFETWASLEDIDEGYYYCGDFNAWVEGATNKEALAFLNVAAKLIEGLDEIENKQVAAINEALNKTKNIL